MIKKIMALVVLCTVLIMCLGFFSDFGGTFENKGISIEPTLITEHTELISVFKEHDIVWKKGIPIWDRYDSNFFEKKALILYFFGVSGDVDPRITLDKIQIDDEVIKVSLFQHGMTAGLAYFPKYLVIEISKSYIGELTKVLVDIEIK
jgi:hypothetical protein